MEKGNKMNGEIIGKKLTVTLNDDMLRCAVEMGYRIPCVSISHYYGKRGVFQIRYKDGQIIRYELDIYDKNDRWMALYSIQP